MIAFVDRGEGPPVTFLHGFALDGRMWSAQARALEATHRTLAADLPGFGPQGSANAPECPALAVLDVLDRLGVARTHLVGHSLGGAVAVDLALAHPERVESLTLVNALLLGLPTGIASRAACTVAAREGRFDDARRAWFDDALFDGVRPGVFAEAERLARDYACGHWTGEVSLCWIVESPLERLGELGMPALVVNGEGEPPPFLAMAAEYAGRMARARRVVLADTAHLSSLEAPDAFLAALRTLIG